MVTRSPRRRGAGNIGCLISLLILAVVLFYGINIGELYWRYYQLLDAIKSQARVAPSLTDETIRRRLILQVEELGLPPDASKFTIRRSGRTRLITIETEYTESVDLPFFNHTFRFHPKAEAGL
jgi:hypothetical protein